MTRNASARVRDLPVGRWLGGRICGLARRAVDGHERVEHCVGRNVFATEDPNNDRLRVALLAEIHRFGCAQPHSDTVEKGGGGRG